jgi:hypothetical protein
MVGTLLNRSYSIFTTSENGVLNVDSLCLPPPGIWDITLVCEDTKRPAQVVVRKDSCLLSSEEIKPYMPFEVVF